MRQSYNQLHTFFSLKKEWEYKNLTHFHIVLRTILINVILPKQILTTKYKKQTIMICTKNKRAANRQERINKFHQLRITPFLANVRYTPPALVCCSKTWHGKVNYPSWFTYLTLFKASWVGVCSQCRPLSVGDPGTKGTKPRPPNIGRMKASSNFRQ